MISIDSFDHFNLIIDLLTVVVEYRVKYSGTLKSRWLKFYRNIEAIGLSNCLLTSGSFATKVASTHS
ncbi:CLUMA_CG012918, isoform A [Clunio marinus]|uniref:CLUMA_CG012918, isoform A n=1 Tax=Clunio marinus TaxID=568069 RepID=A0A1J1IKJ7_9DIPT|nr:CLUMA_CG012918, isoform A [Clunio marinus]